MNDSRIRWLTIRKMWKSWLLSLGPGCRLLKPQQLVTPPPGHSALLRIRLFCEMSESLFFVVFLPWSAGLATSVWTPRCSPLAVSSESLAVLQEISSSSHNTPGGRLLRQGAGSVPPLSLPMCPSISDKSEQVRQRRCSLMLNLLRSVVIREKPCVSFPRLRPRRTGCAIFGVYEGKIGGKQWGGGVTWERESRCCDGERERERGENMGQKTLFNGCLSQPAAPLQSQQWGEIWFRIIGHSHAFYLGCLWWIWRGQTIQSCETKPTDVLSWSATRQTRIGPEPLAGRIRAGLGFCSWRL